MLNPICHCSKEILGYPITAHITQVKNDWQINLHGGCDPHIGSVSVAYWEDNKVSLEHVILANHKDYLVGDTFAAEFSNQLKTTVCVLSGIHYDNLTPSEIKLVVDCCNDIRKELSNKLIAMLE